jgi:hypothetical protein
MHELLKKLLIAAAGILLCTANIFAADFKAVKTLPAADAAAAPIAIQPAANPAATSLPTDTLSLPANKLPSASPAGGVQPQKSPVTLPQVNKPAALPTQTLPTSPAGLPAALPNGGSQITKPVGNFGNAKSLAGKIIPLTPQLSWNDIKNEPNSSILVDQNGNQMSVGDLKSVVQEAINSSNGAELNMIEIQSLISKRATALQLTTAMLNSMNETQRKVAGNLRDGGTSTPKEIITSRLEFNGYIAPKEVTTNRLEFNGYVAPTEVTTSKLEFNGYVAPKEVTTSRLEFNGKIALTLPNAALIKQPAIISPKSIQAQ